MSQTRILCGDCGFPQCWCVCSLCDNCHAACCRHVTIKVGAMTEDEARWANMRGTVNGDMWRLPVKCEQLGGDDRCMIYETRPDVCRKYAVDGPMCKAARAAMERERAVAG